MYVVRLLLLLFIVNAVVSINELCGSLGEQISAPVEVPILGNSYTRVPSKAGNKHWSALFYKLFYNKAPPSSVVLRVNDPFYKKCRRNKKKGFSSQDNIWLIVRNPYVRILSTYLEKIALPPQGERDEAEWLYTMYKKQATFTETIHEILRIVLEGLPDHLSWTLSPYERARRLCLIDHHFCIQSAYLFVRDIYPPSNPIRVLHSEYQLYWYSKFLQCFDISYEQVVGDEWIPYNGKPCFYSPSDNCNVTDYSSNSRNINVTTVLAAMASAEEDSHSTGSSTKVYSYYNKDLATNISYLLEYDLRMLKYPIWDGISQLPLPPYKQDIS